MAVALYFLDKLALRAGHEKDEDEADTVGCCTLKVGGSVGRRGDSGHGLPCPSEFLAGPEHVLHPPVWPSFCISASSPLFFYLSLSLKRASASVPAV